MEDKEQQLLAHKKAFDEIIKKYNFAEEGRAQELANFLAKPNQQISHKEFAQLFGMSEEEAQVFLSFIQKGLDFKKEMH
ncbi:MAG: hypothetical protein VX028_01560 [Nanoarchaeota archaeon]|nr:hypothetical protein [Nanoarchaeota archaeon]MEC8339801.1 hypothetical protein [Nanoarchaeota archaeon]